MTADRAIVLAGERCPGCGLLHATSSFACEPTVASADPHIAAVVDVSAPGATLAVHEIRLTEQGRRALGLR